MVNQKQEPIVLNSEAYQAALRMAESQRMDVNEFVSELVLNHWCYFPPQSHEKEELEEVFGLLRSIFEDAASLRTTGGLAVSNKRTTP